MTAGVFHRELNELLGIPTSAVVGRGLADGVIELRDRKTGEQTQVPVNDFVASVVALVTN